MNTYIQQLTLTNPLREPVIHKAIQALQLPPNSKGLDAGCGLGYQAIQLAKAIGSEGHVTGLDMSPEFLEYANELAIKAGLSNQITFRDGNVNNLPFDDNTFDWAWSADCR